MSFSTLSDKATIHAFLETNRPYHAYALADLASPYFEQCRWLATGERGNIDALTLIFEGLSPPVLLTMGKAPPVDALAVAELPTTVMFGVLPEHLEAVTTVYKPDYLDPMLRMYLPSTAFKPVKNLAVQRLKARHLAVLTELYHGNHGNAFAPYQLEQGVFYGLFVQDKLVSVAGTHIVSTEYRVGAVGNVFTQPEHRGQGYAQQVTSAVCGHLLKAGLTVVLNVEANNQAAVAVYRKLGFEIHSQFQEGLGHRR